MRFLRVKPRTHPVRKISILAAALLLTLLFTASPALAGPLSDRIRILANLVELPPGVTESASFEATFANNPMLAGQTVSLTEPANPMLQSDKFGLVVNRPGAAGNGSMDVIFAFASDAEVQPAANGAVKIPENGALLDLTNRPDLFGAPLPFKLAVSSDVEGQPSFLPSDRVNIDASIDEKFGAESTVFSGVFPNDPNLKNAVGVLTERGNKLVSDLITLDVVRILDNLGRPIAMDVEISLVSDPEAQGGIPLGAVVIGQETGDLQDLTNRPDIWGSNLPFTLQVSSDAPEPSTLALLAVGGIGVLAMARRRGRPRSRK
jgi:hypothetical protein